YPFYLVGERRSPWLLDQPREGRNVVGQVFEVDVAALREMDVLERVDVPGGYSRKVIEVQPAEISDAPAFPVFAYLKNPAEFTSEATSAIGPLHEYTQEHAALYRSRSGSNARTTGPLT
ncbi:MAG: gamma-glutamylcyclotransferase family protein, partial [Ramlibacter sp.]